MKTHNMNNKNLGIGVLGIGVAMMILSPKEKLSVEEQTAGVMTYRGIGSWFVVIGGAMLLYNKFK
jgi:hypothetical protein